MGGACRGHVGPANGGSYTHRYILYYIYIHTIIQDTYIQIHTILHIHTYYNT